MSTNRRGAALLELHRMKVARIKRTVDKYTHDLSLLTLPCALSEIEGSLSTIPKLREIFNQPTEHRAHSSGEKGRQSNEFHDILEDLDSCEHQLASLCTHTKLLHVKGNSITEVFTSLQLKLDEMQHEREVQRQFANEMLEEECERNLGHFEANLLTLASRIRWQGMSSSQTIFSPPAGSEMCEIAKSDKPPIPFKPPEMKSIPSTQAAPNWSERLSEATSSSTSATARFPSASSGNSNHHSINGLNPRHSKDLCASSRCNCCGELHITWLQWAFHPEALRNDAIRPANHALNNPSPPTIFPDDAYAMAISNPRNTDSAAPQILLTEQLDRVTILSFPLEADELQCEANSETFPAKIVTEKHNCQSVSMLKDKTVCRLVEFRIFSSSRTQVTLLFSLKSVEEKDPRDCFVPTKFAQLHFVTFPDTKSSSLHTRDALHVALWNWPILFGVLLGIQCRDHSVLDEIMLSSQTHNINLSMSGRSMMGRVALIPHRLTGLRELVTSALDSPRSPLPCSSYFEVAGPDQQTEDESSQMKGKSKGTVFLIYLPRTETLYQFTSIKSATVRQFSFPEWRLHSTPGMGKMSQLSFVVLCSGRLELWSSARDPAKSDIPCCWKKLCINLWQVKSPTDCKVFVRHCLTVIPQLTATGNWRYLHTTRNPADWVSSGISVGDLLNVWLCWTHKGRLKFSSEAWWRNICVRPSQLCILTSAVCWTGWMESREYPTVNSNLYSSIRRVAIRNMRFGSNCKRPAVPMPAGLPQLDDVRRSESTPAGMEQQEVHNDEKNLSVCIPTLTLIHGNLQCKHQPIHGLNVLWENFRGDVAAVCQCCGIGKVHKVSKLIARGVHERTFRHLEGFPVQGRKSRRCTRMLEFPPAVCWRQFLWQIPCIVAPN